ncbi:indole-3-glycerol-phosphate synthase [Aureococcus anophagefferens]|nr:indole-3-glycerol-phosphate synthase [Aureococcus anophagefferens]
MSPPQPAGGGHEHCFPFRGELEDDESQAEWRELCQAVVHEARAKHYTSVGGDLASLVHLERLDVSANEMDRFQPGARADALQILQAYSNRFASLGTLPSLPEARFLGFGFNELSALPADLGRRCPNLASLDLAFNHLLLLPNYRVRLVTQLPALETIDDAEVTAAEREEYVLPEGGFKEDLDGFVTIEVALKSPGLPAPEGADSAPNSRPGTGKKDEKRKSIKKDKKKDDEGEPAAAPRPTRRRRAATDREQIKLVEAAKLDFNGDFLASLEPPPEDARGAGQEEVQAPGTITVVVRLNPGDDD